MTETSGTTEAAIDDIRALEKTAGEQYAAFVKARDEWTAAGAPMSGDLIDRVERTKDSYDLAAFRAEELRAKLGLGGRNLRGGLPMGGGSASRTPGETFRAAMEATNGNIPPAGSVKLGNFLESFLDRPLGPRFRAAIESGTVRRNLQTDTFSAYPHRRPTILEVIPRESVGELLGGDTLAYLHQTAYSSGAAVRTALSEIADSTITVERATTTLYTISNVSEQVSHQLLRSFPECESWVDNELTNAVLEAAENYALNGNGSGVPDGVGHISGTNAQARGSDTPLECVRKAITTLQALNVEPDNIAIAVEDWESMDLETDGQGRPLFGNPGERTMPRLWGLPVYPTTALAAGTAIVGNWTLGAKQWFGGSRAVWTEAISDDAKKGAMRFIAEMGYGFAVLRPNYFTLCTGL